MKKAFIYIIKNTKNNKVYIGQTKTTIDIRWNEHLRHTEYGNQVINRAMKKYGKDKFYIEILEECTIENVNQKEIFYIEKFNSANSDFGYNVSLGGETPNFERKEYDIQFAIELYSEGKSLDYISKLLKISRYILRQDFVKNNIKIRDRYFYNRKCNQVSKEQILDLINNKLSMRQIAKNLKIPYSTLRNAFEYYNIEYNSTKSAQHPIEG